MQCTGRSAHSMHIRWEPPASDHQNGRLTGYSVQLRERFADNPQLAGSQAQDLIIRVALKNEPMPSTRAQERLVEALYATDYTVSVRAATSAGLGKASDEIPCTTSLEGPPHSHSPFSLSFPFLQFNFDLPCLAFPISLGLHWSQ